MTLVVRGETTVREDSEEEGNCTAVMFVQMHEGEVSCCVEDDDGDGRIQRRVRRPQTSLEGKT